MPGMGHHADLRGFIHIVPPHVAWPSTQCDRIQSAATFADTANWGLIIWNCSAAERSSDARRHPDRLHPLRTRASRARDDGAQVLWGSDTPRRGAARWVFD